MKDLETIQPLHTFWTISYRGQYIHGHYDRSLRREVIKVENKQFLSLRSAKRWITITLSPKL